MKPSDLLVEKSNQAAQALFEEASAIYNSGNLQQTKIKLEEALKAYPRHFNALNYMGIVHARINQPAVAVTYFKKAIEVDPNIPAAHNNLGQVFDDLHQYDTAMACFDRAIALNPKYEQAIGNRVATEARALQQTTRA
jgi:Tfp pilus assembly protein PilF